MESPIYRALFRVLNIWITFVTSTNRFQTSISAAWCFHRRTFVLRNSLPDNLIQPVEAVWRTQTARSRCQHSMPLLPAGFLWCPMPLRIFHYSVKTLRNSTSGVLQSCPESALLFVVATHIYLSLVAFSLSRNELIRGCVQQIYFLPFLPWVCGYWVRLHPLTYLVGVSGLCLA